MALVALVLAVRPQQLAADINRFDVRAIPAVVALSIGYYLLQGVRWQYLLRAVGIRLPMGDVILLNYAGQSTGLLPFGELTRAVLVSEAAIAEIGAVVATITVQELLYTLIIIAAAVPGALEHRSAATGIIAALVGTIMVFIILLVSPVYRGVRAVVRRTPLLRHYTADVDELQRDTAKLLRRWDTLVFSALSVAGAMVSITLFWLVVHSLRPGLLSWHLAAFIYAVSQTVGAITLSPGGLGSFEASTVGLMISVGGADPALAGAAALMQRGADKGLATLMGIAAYLVARRRYRFDAVNLFRPDQARARARRARLRERGPEPTASRGEPAALG